MVSRDTQIFAVFVVLAVALWYGSAAIIDNSIISFALLIAVGVILPTLFTELRNPTNS